MKTIREETNSKIRVCEGTLQCEDRVIVIAAREDAADESEDSNAQASTRFCSLHTAEEFLVVFIAFEKRR